MTVQSLELPAPGLHAEWAAIVDELTRRGLLAGGLGTAALLGLAACGSGGHPTAASSAGPWTYTDDLGQRVTTRQQRPHCGRHWPPTRDCG